MNKKIVVIGGGHGQSTILRGIKEIPDVDISAIVTVADDGGSTGRIRNLYPIPAMGDIRNTLVALSQSDSIMSKLMDFRFKQSTNNLSKEDIQGHNLGNLILTAITEYSGSFKEAIDAISKELDIKGKVIPSSFDVITLYAKMDDDTIVKGEDNIPNFNHHIKEIFYTTDVKANKEAIEAILNADILIYGIGSVYTSIIPNIIIKEIKEAIDKTKALKVYFANCMTQNNETFDYTLKDHVDAIEKHGGLIDLIVKHKEKIPMNVMEKYLNQNSIEVIDSGDVVQEVLERRLLEFDSNLVRHNPLKIKEVVEELLERVK